MPAVPLSPPRLHAGCQATPHLLSTIAIQTEAEDEGDDVEQVAVQEQSDEGGSADGSLELEGGQACCWPPDLL